MAVPHLQLQHGYHITPVLALPTKISKSPIRLNLYFWAFLPLIPRTQVLAAEDEDPQISGAISRVGKIDLSERS